MAIESKSNREDKEKTQNRRAVNIAVWIPVGTGAGVALGVAMGNIALGIAIGAAIGVVIGTAMQFVRIRDDAESAGTSGKMGWILAAAVVGGSAVLVGGIILYETLLK